MVLDAILIGLQVVLSVALVVLILLHAGRGGGLSDMFGGAAAGGAMAGATIVEKNLDRLTVIAAIVWSFTTLLLGLRL